MTDTLLANGHACEGGCGRVRRLLARTVRGLLCPWCWRAAGEPLGKRNPEDKRPLGEIEAATRARMIARGGADAHIVHKGLT